MNARDAMPRGGRLSISTWTESRGAVRYASVRVADTGSGIDPGLLPHLFEPFFTTKEVGRGTGLGLAMVGDFVRSSEGFTEVDTALGAGASFTLCLPAVGAPVAVPSETESSRAAATGQETILLIEDDDAVRELTRRMLVRAGYTVVEARYGTEALELAHDGRRFELVLSDVVMPGLSGPEVVARLQARRPGVPAIFMSGYAPQTEGPLGGAELVRKPFTATRLLAAVRSALDLETAEQHAAVVPA